MTYYLNNITAFKENEKYKDLGVPKIHLEFEVDSADFLVFEEAEAWLNETQIVEVAEEKKVEKKKKNETSTSKDSKEGEEKEKESE